MYFQDTMLFTGMDGLLFSLLVDLSIFLLFIVSFSSKNQTQIVFNP